MEVEIELLIMNDLKLRALPLVTAICSILLMFCACEKAPETVPVKSVSVDKPTAELVKGGTLTLVSTVEPADASNKNVKWSSSNESVATVDANGKVTAKAAGTATITVTTEDGGKTASCVVSVISAIESVSLDRNSLDMVEGDTEILTATISPSDASNKDMKWSSSDEGVATVDANGKVTAKAAGTATITVTTEDGGKTATCTVTVSSKVINVSGVTLTPSTTELIIGGTVSIAAEVSPSDASDKSVTWSSSDESVATVSSTGVVTAKSVGTAVITVTTTDGGKTATCTVTVNPILVTGVSVSPATLALTEGENQTLSATVSPDNATDKSVTWSSSDESVATVDADGKVTAKAKGTATITAKANDGSNKSGSCTVTVSEMVYHVTGVSLNTNTITLTIGGIQTLSATVAPENASNKDVSWSSSDESVATVSSTGVVTAKSVGTAVITVTTTDGGKTATCTVTVDPIHVSGVTMNPTTATIVVGNTQNNSATVSPANATDKTLTWSSSNESVATVSSTGVVTAKSAGTAVITVTTTDGGKTATCTVTVENKSNVEDPEEGENWDWD